MKYHLQEIFGGFDAAEVLKQKAFFEDDVRVQSI